MTNREAELEADRDEWKRVAEQRAEELAELEADRDDWLQVSRDWRMRAEAAEAEVREVREVRELRAKLTALEDQ